MSPLAPTLQAFFTERLVTQRHASRHTIASYRDTLRLLLAFAGGRTGTPPSRLEIGQPARAADRGVPRSRAHRRGNGPRTRNARLAAIHSLFRYAALRHPEHAALIQRVLAIPPTAPSGGGLLAHRREVDALLAAPDTTGWLGRRDHALLLVAVQTGLRVSELTRLAAPTLRSSPRRICAAPARDGRNASSRSPGRPSRPCGPG